MKSLPKLLSVLVFVLSFSIWHLAFSIDRVAAANAIPDPFVPCSDQAIFEGKKSWEDPEFNSLRPYQASPCGDAPKAYFCDNDYIIEEKVSTLWSTIGGKCSENGGEYICKVDQIIEKDYEITMKDVNFPILGNTQNVTNSQNPDDEFDDAQKLNEYVSWYLSGANQKAEYGEDSNDRIINFSGPLKKLVPSVIQELQRFKVLHSAGVKQKYTDESEKDKNPDAEGVEIDETWHHNQIVVCVKANSLGFNFTGFFPSWGGTLRPAPCYGTNLIQIVLTALGDAGIGLADKLADILKKADGGQLRLLNWWEGKYTGLADSYNVIEGWDGSQIWNSTVPPFPWQFTEDLYYQKAYAEWRGRECSIETTPIFGKLNKIFGKKLLCIDINPFGILDLNSNKWADFYQYIPLGTTTDKAAGHVIGGVNIKGLGETIAGRPQDAQGNSESGTYFVEQNPVLYYPHTRSTYDMATLLNETQTPQDVFGEKGKSEENKGATKDFETNKCEIVDVRSNPGDDLTFDQKNVEEKQRAYVRDVQIEVTQIGCSQATKECLEKCIPNPLNPSQCLPKICACEGIVQVVIRSTPKIPFADQIWEATTVGQESAFRRIFPKVEEGAPVSCIADIPGVSDVNYLPSSQTNLVGIDTPDGRKSPDEAQLFFPHLGTVYEYFLKGIQTALRPQGYGEPIVNGELCETDDSISCDQVAQEYGIPSCQLEGIMQLETGGGTNMGTESCGNANCCSAGVCGPAQIKCGDIESVSGGENINVCEPCGSAELLARLMLMKVCQAKGQCNSYDWKSMKANAEKYKNDVQIKNYTAACYFYGLQNGCFPTACTQYRWGPGKSYGDKVASFCGGPAVPDNLSPQFCTECAKEDPRVQCSAPTNPNQNQNQQIPI